MRRKTRRILLALAAIPVALVALRLVWGLEASHRLAKVDARLHALGLDAAPPPVDPANDPETILASVTVPLAENEESLLNGSDQPGVAAAEVTWTAQQLPQVRALLARCQPLFADAQRAVQLTGPTVQPAPGTFPAVGTMRSLAELLGAAALLDHRDGNDAQALQRIQTIMALARTSDLDHTLIGHLVAIAITSMGDGYLERLAPDLHFDAAGNTRREALQLLQVLQSQPRQSNAAQLATWPGELAFTDYYFSHSKLNAWWSRAWLDDETARCHAVFISNYEISKLQSWPEANKALHDLHLPLDIGEMSQSNLETATSFLSMEFLPTFNKAFLLHFRTQSDTAAAQLLLAAALYKDQHQAYPPTAAALVPEILPALPVDPFSADHAPMHYRLDAGGPTLWSVSEDGIDNGGPVNRSDDGTRLRRYGTAPHNQPDIVYGAAWRGAPVR